MYYAGGHLSFGADRPEVVNLGIHVPVGNLHDHSGLHIGYS